MTSDPSLGDRTSGPLDPTVLRMLEQVRLPICVTDPHAEDNPIVYVNPAFLELTGYDVEDVLNRNCRFLQGPETRPESVEEIRQAIHEESVTTIEILNYRKDGSTFVNALQIGPIRDDDGRTILHFGSQLDVTEKRAAERRADKIEMEERAHRLRNIVNVMSVAVRMTARDATSVQDFAKTVTERLDMLGRAHFSTFEEGGELPVRELAETVLCAYAPLGASQIELDGPDVPLSTARITPLTLVMHELATNSVKHGALGAETGRVSLTWSGSVSERLDLTWRERGGPKVRPPERRSGSRIIGAVVSGIGGSLDYDWDPDGLIVRISLPG